MITVSVFPNIVGPGFCVVAGLVPATIHHVPSATLKKTGQGMRNCRKNDYLCSIEKQH